MIDLSFLKSIGIDLSEVTFNIIKIVIIFLFTFLFAKMVRKVSDRYFDRASKLIKTDITNHNFLKHFLSAMIYVLGIGLAIYTIPSLRTISVSIFASAGLLAVILGFAAQQAFSNIISGIVMVIFKPFRVGDRVKINENVSGMIEDITLRHTIIRNFENKRIIIPNSVLSNEIIENSSIGDTKICKYVEFSISYDSDIDKAMKIMQEEAVKHPFFIDNRTKEEIKNKEPIVPVRLVGFTDSGVNLRAWVWTPDPSKAFKLGCDLNKSIKERFDKAGIEIPYPYRTIIYKEKKKK